jgi:hypothetical protein
MAIELGQLQREYKVRPNLNRANLIFGRLFVIAGMLLLLYTFYITFFTEPDGIQYLFGTVGFLIALLGWLGLRIQKQETSICVQVFSEGFSYSRSGKTDQVRWDDITEATLGVVQKKLRHHRVILETFYEYRITPQSGTEIQFRLKKNAIPDIEQFSNTIRNEVTRRQLPKAIATFNEGGTIQFGNLSVSGTGINNGKETMAWSDIEELKLNKGSIKFLKKDKSSNWPDVLMGQTPNVFVFMALVNNVLKNRSEPTSG